MPPPRDCKVCCKSNAIYRCPGCLADICSVACSKQHKVLFQCTGTENTLKYRSRRQLFTEPDKVLNRDYAFLTRVQRDIEVAREDNNTITTVGGKRKHEDPEESGNISKRKKSDRFKKEASLQRAYKECGVLVERLPAGMTRSRDNRTFWDRKHKCLSWTMEILVNVDLQQASSSIKHGVRETRILDELVKDVCLGAADVVAYLLKIKTPASQKQAVVELDMRKSIAENLKRRRVIEFPTLVITNKPDAYRIEKDWKMPVLPVNPGVTQPTSADDLGSEGSDDDEVAPGDDLILSVASNPHA